MNTRARRAQKEMGLYGTPKPKAAKKVVKKSAKPIAESMSDPDVAFEDAVDGAGGGDQRSGATPPPQSTNLSYSQADLLNLDVANSVSATADGVESGRPAGAGIDEAVDPFIEAANTATEEELSVLGALEQEMRGASLEELLAYRERQKREIEDQLDEYRHETERARVLEEERVKVEERHRREQLEREIYAARKQSYLLYKKTDALQQQRLQEQREQEARDREFHYTRPKKLDVCPPDMSGHAVVAPVGDTTRPKERITTKVTPTPVASLVDIGSDREIDAKEDDDDEELALLESERRELDAEAKLLAQAERKLAKERIRAETQKLKRKVRLRAERLRKANERLVQNEFGVDSDDSEPEVANTGCTLSAQSDPWVFNPTVPVEAPKTRPKTVYPSIALGASRPSQPRVPDIDAQSTASVAAIDTLCTKLSESLGKAANSQVSIPKFLGDDTDFDDWYEELEAKALAMNWSNIDRYRATAGAMEGQARQWFIPVHNQNYTQDWGFLLASMRERFGSAETDILKVARVCSLYQDANETNNAFIDRVVRRSARLIPPLPMSAVMKTIRCGIRNRELKSYVASATTPAEVRSRVREWQEGCALSNSHQKSNTGANTGTTTNTNPNALCFKCGKPGHSFRNCPDNTANTTAVLMCQYCSKPGHTAAECRSLKAAIGQQQPTASQTGGAPTQAQANIGSGTSAQRTGEGPECYNCHEFGHISRNCPLPQRQRRNAYNPNGSASQPNSGGNQYDPNGSSQPLSQRSMEFAATIDAINGNTNYTMDGSDRADGLHDGRSLTNERTRAVQTVREFFGTKPLANSVPSSRRRAGRTPRGHALVNGRPVVGLFDTAGSQTSINMHVVNACHLKLEPYSGGLLSLADGSTARPMGIANNVRITAGNRTVCMTVTVFNDPYNGCTLGMDFLESIDFVFNARRREWHHSSDGLNVDPMDGNECQSDSQWRCASPEELLALKECKLKSDVQFVANTEPTLVGQNANKCDVNVNTVDLNANEVNVKELNGNTNAVNEAIGSQTSPKCLVLDVLEVIADPTPVLTPMDASNATDAITEALPVLPKKSRKRLNHRKTKRLNVLCHKRGANQLNTNSVDTYGVEVIAKTGPKNIVIFESDFYCKLIVFMQMFYCFVNVFLTNAKILNTVLCKIVNNFVMNGKLDATERMANCPESAPFGGTTETRGMDSNAQIGGHKRANTEDRTARPPEPDPSRGRLGLAVVEPERVPPFKGTYYVNSPIGSHTLSQHTLNRQSLLVVQGVKSCLD